MFFADRHLWKIFSGFRVNIRFWTDDNFAQMAEKMTSPDLKICRKFHYIYGFCFHKSFTFFAASVNDIISFRLNLGFLTEAIFAQIVGKFYVSPHHVENFLEFFFFFFLVEFVYVSWNSNNYFFFLISTRKTVTWPLCLLFWNRLVTSLERVPEAPVKWLDFELATLPIRKRRLWPFLGTVPKKCIPHWKKKKKKKTKNTHVPIFLSNFRVPNKRVSHMRVCAINQPWKFKDASRIFDMWSGGKESQPDFRSVLPHGFHSH